MAEDRAFYSQQIQNPAVRKLLETIRYAEGTAGPRGYQTLFGGGTVGDLSRHPDRPVSAGGYTSTAAGAYQFLTPTWQGVAKKLGLSSFNPTEQDIAGAYLAHQRLKPIGGFATLEKEGLSPRVAAALAPEWASFPTQAGTSYYGQPVKGLKELQQRYGQASVGQQQQQQQPPPTVSAVPGRTFIVIDGEGNENLPFLKDFIQMRQPAMPKGLDVASILLNSALNPSTPNY